MRLLFTFIVTSFLFLTSSGREKVVELGVDKAAVITGQPSKFDCGDYLQNSHLTLFNLFKESRKPAKQARLYLGFFTVTRPTVLSSAASSRLQRMAAPAYSYCTPIALKLLFPKHYFW